MQQQMQQQLLLMQQQLLLLLGMSRCHRGCGPPREVLLVTSPCQQRSLTSRFVATEAAVAAAAVAAAVIAAAAAAAGAEAFLAAVFGPLLCSLQRQVASLLEQQGISFLAETQTPEGLAVDFRILSLPAANRERHQQQWRQQQQDQQQQQLLRLVLEVDGPTHFLLDS